MKKLVFATMMCIAAMSANAQVLNTETVKNVYDTVTHQAKGDYAFNAEWSNNNITTMYVYKKEYGNGLVTLKPHMKYDYTYAADGTLTSRVASRWTDSQYNWALASRHDYNLSNGKYAIEYSRYNHVAESFDQPVEMMVYMMQPDDSVNYISFYQRQSPSADFQLISETFIPDEMPLLFAQK